MGSVDSLVSRQAIARSKKQTKKSLHKTIFFWFYYRVFWSEKKQYNHIIEQTFLLLNISYLLSMAL